MQQAQLQRTSEFAQSLISAGGSAAGAGAVASSLKDYSPWAALTNSGAKVVNSLITFGVQQKQFNWSVDNIKSAPGNYKAAAATVSFMLSLDIYNLWIEQYKANDFDLNIYDELIDDAGLEYFNFTYNLNQIMANIFTGTSNKKFLQAVMTGLTNTQQINMTLINILYRVLQEGVNVFL
jgi:hypothetical protein